MKYELKSSQFCALAHDPAWQSWLGDTAPDLLGGLKGHLSKSKSCKSNKEYMYQIRKELTDRGLNQKFIKFLRDVFPVVLKPINVARPSARKAQKKEIMSPDELNKHEVFGVFRPGVLVFPHRMIIVDQDEESLLRRVRKFTKTKISIDYIIIEDRAYVEYFEQKFAEEASKVPQESRDIFRYRKKNKT